MANNNSKGVSGSNVITGGSGNDRINGGASSDTLNGGAGSDTLNGDSSNDLLIYTLAENGSATDNYIGGSGIDTVRINLTQDEWMSAAVEYQLALYYQHLSTIRTNPITGEVSSGSARDFTFDFGNGTNLTVQMMERLEIAVDGVVIEYQDKPVIKNGPQAADVVEDGDTDASVSTAQSASGSIEFFDLDLTDSHVISVAGPAGAYGALTASVSNTTLGDSQGTVAWSYQLNNAAVQFLAVGETRSEVFTVRIADANIPANFAETQVTITITGTNDVPVITAQDLVGGVTELVNPAGDIIDSGTISFSDVDLTDVHLVSAQPVGTTLGSLIALKDTDTTGSGTDGKLTWTYSVAASAVEYLAAGQTKVESFTVTLDDQNGGVVSRQVDITLTGTNDAPVITSEDLTGAVIAPMQNVAAPPSPLVFTVQQFLGYQSNNLTDLRNYASSHTANYTVQTNVIDYTDDTGGFAGELPGSSRWPAAVAQGVYGTGGINNVFFARITANFSVSVADTYTFRTYNDDGVFLLIDNNLIISDTGYHPEVPFTGSIALTPGNHTIELFFFENGGEASLEFSARTSTGSFGLVGGTGGGFGGLPQVTDSGVITFSDVDLTDVHLVSASGTPVGETLGSLSAVKNIDTTGSGTGGQLTWTYKAPSSALVYLSEGETKVESFTITLNDQHGGLITKQIDVTITGTNDVPVITAEDLAGGVTELVTPAGNLTDSGTISFSDVDLTDVHLVSAAGTPVGTVLGTLSAAKDSDTTGTGTGGQLTWTYSVAASAVEYLAAGQTKVESFTISLDDQNGGVINKQIDVTITGTNDVPVISGGNVAGSVSEDDVLVATGSLVASDLDTSDLLSFSGGGSGTYGSLTIDSNGTWEYLLDNSSELVQGLTADDTVNDVFTVQVSDGNGGFASTDITLTVNGADDGNPPVDIEDVSTDFEDGFAGWETIGSTSIVDSTNNSGKMAQMNGTGASEAAIEAFFGAEIPDSYLGTFGSAIKTTLSLQAGNTVSFDYFFNTTDYIPYNDFAVFMGIDGEMELLSNVAMVGDYGQSEWATVELEISTTGVYDIGFASINAIDAILHSQLWVDNLQIFG